MDVVVERSPPGFCQQRRGVLKGRGWLSISQCELPGESCCRLRAATPHRGYSPRTPRPLSSCGQAGDGPHTTYQSCLGVFFLI